MRVHKLVSYFSSETSMVVNIDINYLFVLGNWDFFFFDFVKFGLTYKLLFGFVLMYIGVSLLYFKFSNQYSWKKYRVDLHLVSIFSLILVVRPPAICWRKFWSIKPFPIWNWEYYNFSSLNNGFRY